MNFFKEIIERVKSKTPPFFKKIRTIGLGICGICGPIVAIPTTYTGAIISDTLIKICSHALVAGIIMSSVSTLAKDQNQNNGTTSI